MQNGLAGLAGGDPATQAPSGRQPATLRRGCLSAQAHSSQGPPDSVTAAAQLPSSSKRNQQLTSWPLTRRRAAGSSGVWERGRRGASRRRDAEFSPGPETGTSLSSHRGWQSLGRAGSGARPLCPGAPPCGVGGLPGGCVPRGGAWGGACPFLPGAAVVCVGRARHWARGAEVTRGLGHTGGRVTQTRRGAAPRAPCRGPEGPGAAVFPFLGPVL